MIVRKHVVTSAAEPRAGDRAAESADRTRPRPDAATPPHTTRDTRRHRAAHTLHINHTHADTHSHTRTGQTPCPPCAPLHFARNSRTQPTRLKPPLRSCSRASLLLLDPNAHRQLLRALDSEIRFASAKHPPGRSFLVSCPRESELQRVLRVRVREVSR